MSEIKRVETTPYSDQKPGTSGLRKPTRVFLEKPNYTQNFVQSILDAIGDKENKALIVGGDGRFYCKDAVNIIVQIAAASGIRSIIIGQNGILSTPAVSNLIRKWGNCAGGIILTASHNPGGRDGDFGIKFNMPNGGPAPDHVTEKIFELSKEIKRFKKVDIHVDISVVGKSNFQIIEIGEVLVEVIDSVEDYVNLMKDIFDFELLKGFLAQSPIVIDAMHGVTGPYVERIFRTELKVSDKSRLLNTVPLEDFGGGHPDPNLTYAKDLVDILKSDPTFIFGCAYDGDGDRNMILGTNGFFVTPSDSLAVLGANLTCIKYFQKEGVKGLARSMPTSEAVDRVGEKLGLNVFQVPTGWKYFGNLMDAGKISLCGEESFGTGSDHIREKDGIWASLAFLSVLASNKQSVEQMLTSHWKTFGRNYFLRLDYENVDGDKANLMMSELEKTLKDVKLDGVKLTDNYEFTDSVDGSVAKKQGLRLIFEDGRRIVWRLSGTGSSGATVRVYIEQYEGTDVGKGAMEFLGNLVELSLKLSKLKDFLGVDKPTVIT